MADDKLICRNTVIDDLSDYIELTVPDNDTIEVEDTIELVINHSVQVIWTCSHSPTAPSRLIVKMNIPQTKQKVVVINSATINVVSVIVNTTVTSDITDVESMISTVRVFRHVVYDTDSHYLLPFYGPAMLTHYPHLTDVRVDNIESNTFELIYRDSDPRYASQPPCVPKYAFISDIPESIRQNTLTRLICSTQSDIDLTCCNVLEHARITCDRSTQSLEPIDIKFPPSILFAWVNDRVIDSSSPPVDTVLTTNIDTLPMLRQLVWNRNESKSLVLPKSLLALTTYKTHYGGISKEERKKLLQIEIFSDERCSLLIEKSIIMKMSAEPIHRRYGDQFNSLIRKGIFPVCSMVTLRYFNLPITFVSMP